MKHLVILALLGVSIVAPGAFVVEETTIAQVHTGFRTGALTCRALVATYLTRVQRFDQSGPTLHAISDVNPKALQEAERLDAAFARGGLTGPLHCVPVIIRTTSSRLDGKPLPDLPRCEASSPIEMRALSRA